MILALRSRNDKLPAAGSALLAPISAVQPVGLSIVESDVYIQ
jgi:hypothetical protein